MDNGPNQWEENVPFLRKKYDQSSCFALGHHCGIPNFALLCKSLTLALVCGHLYFMLFPEKKIQITKKKRRGIMKL